MTTEDALWRELKYNRVTIGIDADVALDHVVVDARDDIAGDKAESDYLWLIITEVTSNEVNDVGYQRDRYVIEIIGLLRSANKGGAAIDTVQNAIKNHFIGKHKTFGKFTAAGAPDSNGGVRLKCEYIDTANGFTEEVREKTKIMQFAFHRIAA